MPEVSETVERAAEADMKVLQAYQQFCKQHNTSNRLAIRNYCETFALHIQFALALDFLGLTLDLKLTSISNEDVWMVKNMAHLYRKFEDIKSQSCSSHVDLPLFCPVNYYFFSLARCKHMMLATLADIADLAIIPSTVLSPLYDPQSHYNSRFRSLILSKIDILAFDKCRLNRGGGAHTSNPSSLKGALHKAYISYKHVRTTLLALLQPPLPPGPTLADPNHMYLNTDKPSPESPVVALLYETITSLVDVCQRHMDIFKNAYCANPGGPFIKCYSSPLCCDIPTIEVDQNRGSKTR